MGFPAGKSLRLTRRTEIRRVFTEGRRLADARLTLWGIPTQVHDTAQTASVKDRSESETGDKTRVPASGEKDRDAAPGPARCGVAVSKAHGKAVRRNRVKRICREAARLIRPDLPAGWDFMIVPRAGADLGVRNIQDSLRALARRLASGGGKEVRP